MSTATEPRRPGSASVLVRTSRASAGTRVGRGTSSTSCGVPRRWTRPEPPPAPGAASPRWIGAAPRTTMKTALTEEFYGARTLLSLLDRAAPDMVPSFTAMLARSTLDDASPLRPATPRRSSLGLSALQRPRVPEWLSCPHAWRSARSRCPVRRECLQDAISERRWTVMGVFGGDYHDRTHRGDQRPAERTPCRSRCRTDRAPPVGLAKLDDEVEIQALPMPPSSWKRPSRLAWRCGGPAETTRVTRGAFAQAVAPQPARSACRRCGGRLSWRQRSDAAYCSAACKQAAYRMRSAA